MMSRASCYSKFSAMYHDHTVGTTHLSGQAFEKVAKRNLMIITKLS